MGTLVQYQIFPTPKALAQHFAKQFAVWAATQLQVKQQLNIVISGGSTPQLWFTELAEHFTDQIDWLRLHFFWVDERYVPHNHPESNFGVACRLLFNQVQIPPGNLHPVPVTGNLDADVVSYTTDIKKHVPTKNGWPVFDLVTLGMGDDGHTASIFPGQLELFGSDVPVSASANPHTGQQRITLTGLAINRATAIRFLVTGKNKAALVNSIFNGLDGSEKYPAAHIRKENAVWLLDREAAGAITMH